MVDTYKPPFGTYTFAQVASAAGQTEIIDDLQSFAALFGITISQDGLTITYTGNASVPDFNKISDGMRKKIAAELAALIIGIESMPTA